MTSWKFDHTSVSFGAGAQGALIAALAQSVNVPTSSPYTLQPTDHLRVLQSGSAGGTLTIDLPAPGALPNGFVCWVMQNSNNIILSPAVGVGLAVPTLGFVTSAITLSQRFQAYMLVCDGTNFYCWPFGGVVSTITDLTSGSGTYNTPAGCLWIRGRMVAAGGGGAAVTTNAGTSGGNTTFGSWTTVGGVGGVLGTGSANGGTGGTDGSGVRVSRIPGKNGFPGTSITGGIGVNGQGGDAPFGWGWGGVQPVTNSQRNGQGFGSGGSSGYSSGGISSGGGAGEGVEFIWPNPPSTISYAVGAAGPGGTAGGIAGGAGASGRILLEEHYA